MLVSVVMGTYNGEKFLVQQLDSILKQTYPRFELLVSDDASTDRTREVLRSYESDPRIKVYYQEKNLGLPANYSFIASKAKGDLVAFSDQDDIWLENKIEKLVSAIGEHQLVYSDSELIDEGGKRTGKKLSGWKKMYSGDDSRGYFLYSCVWGHGMMVKRELLERSLPIPATVHHDIWIAYQAFLHGGIKYLDLPLTLYRQYEKPGMPQHSHGKPPRYEEYRQKLAWLSLMHENERPGYRDFYGELYRLYEKKGKNGYVFPLVPFMLRHRHAIFKLSKKGFASHFIEILKQARSERP